ncbi:hypothetical protein CLU79DRAFT_840889 [Phycomyces nitens]|nr:hypothetical protein CLU79DRAFT_840889 [Phycomyces nitens]
MSLQLLLAAISDKIANLQISEPYKSGECNGHGPTPMTGVEPADSLSEASLPPKKRRSYRVVSLKKP